MAHSGRLDGIPEHFILLLGSLVSLRSHNRSRWKTAMTNNKCTFITFHCIKSGCRALHIQFQSAHARKFREMWSHDNDGNGDDGEKNTTIAEKSTHEHFKMKWLEKKNQKARERQSERRNKTFRAVYRDENVAAYCTIGTPFTMSPVCASSIRDETIETQNACTACTSRWQRANERDSETNLKKKKNGKINCFRVLLFYWHKFHRIIVHSSWMGCSRARARVPRNPDGMRRR